MTHSIVSPEWLNDHINDPDLIILDASTESNAANLIPKYTNCYIPGTRLFDFKGIFSDQKATVPNMMPDANQFSEGCQDLGINNNSKVIVYDNLGIYTSPRAWWMFKTMGHDNVAVLDGGLPAWIDLGYETETDLKPFSKGNFKARYIAENIVDASFVRANITDKEAIVIDARSSARFEGKVPESRKGLKSGHIQGSINLPYKTVLNNGRLKPGTEITEIVRDLDIGGSPMVFTCGSGVTACIILLAFDQVTDNPKSLYDGSWSEWGTF